MFYYYTSCLFFFFLPKALQNCPSRWGLITCFMKLIGRYLAFMQHFCFIYVAFMFHLLLPRFTQMRTDHQLQKFAQKSCYLAFKFHLCDIYIAFCFIYIPFMPLQLKQICPFCRASPRWGLIISFRNLHEKVVFLHLSDIYVTFIMHLCCIYAIFMLHLYP